jgi:hypothetical protein
VLISRASANSSYMGMQAKSTVPTILLGSRLNSECVRSEERRPLVTGEFGSAATRFAAARRYQFQGTPRFRSEAVRHWQSRLVRCSRG